VQHLKLNIAEPAVRKVLLMRIYKQLNHSERVKISVLKQSGASITLIGEQLGRSKSTISRELRRNAAPPGEYWPDTAHTITLTRRFRGCILVRNKQLQSFVTGKMVNHYWTPEQIAGYLKYKQKTLPSVSHETIYSWIYSTPLKSEKLWQYLTRRKRKRGLRKSKSAGASRIPNRISIWDRPKVIENRKEFGHWEGDLVSCQKNSQHMLVLTERKTMLTLSCILKSKTAIETSNKMVTLMERLPTQARKSITFDNGGEFAKHDVVAKELGIKTYFCDPYSSWQKGGVEHANGRLRRDLPRWMNLKTMDKEDFDEVIENYNSTPRKRLNWDAPIQAFNKNINRVALQT